MGETNASDAILKELLNVVDLDVDLDAVVLERGKDYSVGERQLICIARFLSLDKRYILRVLGDICG